MDVILRLIAPNDRSGNPRRLYMGVEMEHGITGLWDEGYEGPECLPLHFQEDGKRAPQINITAGEYKRLKKSRGM